MLSDDDPIFVQAKSMFHQEMAESLEVILQKKFRGKLERFIAYLEFFSEDEDCFAGIQLLESPKIVKLIDVSIYRRGFMTPSDFVDTFSGEPYCASVLYEGRLDEDEVSRVKDGHYGDHEGVVYKGGQSVHQIWRCKVKTNYWRQELIRRKGEHWKNFF